jgi:anion-transporting  ArsA/GET3 family ATPase
MARETGGWMTLTDKLADRRIVVVCGSGGVGKTSVSAALGLWAARQGRRTIVVTVDPALRLATSLGLPRTPGERRTVSAGGGIALQALLLDTKRTFDELVANHAGSAERRDRILSNRFYQRIADTLSGTHEYMAMEQLHQLAGEEDFEAIVVDTPPTRSALSFLDAPQRMTDFLGGRMLRWLLWPYRRAAHAGVRGAGLGARVLARTIGRVAGTELLSDIAEFLTAFEGMYEGFKERAGEVLDLLRRPDTGFVVVAAPERASLEEAGRFVERLGDSGMPLAGVVVNRWPAAPASRADPGIISALTEGTTAQRAAAGCLLVAEELRILEARGRLAIASFQEEHGAPLVATIPDLEADVHDLGGLTRLAGAMLD